jgi:hypothetical protein
LLSALIRTEDRAEILRLRLRMTSWFISAGVADHGEAHAIDKVLGRPRCVILNEVKDLICPIC